MKVKFACVLPQPSAANPLKDDLDNVKIMDYAGGAMNQNRITFSGPGAVFRDTLEMSGLLLLFFTAITLFWNVSAYAQTASAEKENTSKEHAIAYAGRIASENGTTTISLDFQNKPDAAFFFMRNPNRLVIELDDGFFNLGQDNSIDPAGLVSLARFGSITAQKSRLVANLKQPAKISATRIEPIELTTRHRLVVELQETTHEDFLKQIHTQQELFGSSGGVVKKGERVRKGEKNTAEFTIVIDPGHGGIDSGATGRGRTLEKNVTLQVAKLVAKELEETGPFNVALTREDDVFVSLRERLEFTKRQHADLMISIHADTLRQRSVRGATIYTLAKRASDRLAAELAESENLSDVVAGLAAPEQQDQVTDILTDLTLRETTRFSRRFSERLKAKLKERTLLIKNPVRSAAFAVLKSPETPSVLLELGYLSNREDEEQMKDAEWQKTISIQIAKAVYDFFAPRIDTLNAN